MPSTIPITTALKSALTDLLGIIGKQADAQGEMVEFHAVSMWIAALLRNSEAILSASIAAQIEFSSYAINERWLNALDELVQFSGQGIHDFMVSLCRAYLFNSTSAQDALWQQYDLLGQRVSVEMGRRLPDAWGEWDEPMRALLSQFAIHLEREEPIYDYLFNTATVRELADFAPTPMLPQEIALALLPLPSAVDVDDSATLAAYLDWCLGQYSRLDARVPQYAERFYLRLDDMFVARRLRPTEKWTNVKGYVRYQLSANLRTRVNGYRDSPSSCTVTEALDDAVRVLLLAGPGLGKTTLLRHLTLQYAGLIMTNQAQWPLAQRPTEASLLGPDEHLPLYLHLADYVENANTSEEALLDYALRDMIENELHDSSLQSMLLRMLEAGRCVILLDGLDTMADEQDRLMVASRINQLAASWCSGRQRNRIMVAARNTDRLIARLLPDFEAYELPELDRNEINKYLVNWALIVERDNQQQMLDEHTLQSKADKTAIEILREISASEQLRTLAANPLMLRIIARQQYEGHYLPPQPVALLRDAAESVIRDWRLPRGPGSNPRVQEHEVGELLSELAYWLHAHRPSGLASEREVVVLLGDVWSRRHPEADEAAAREAIQDFLARIRHNAGLLSEGLPRRYGFVHLHMQEYFAARYLVGRYRLAASRIRRCLHNPRWSEVVRLAISFVALDSPPDASDLIESAIIAGNSDSPINGSIIPSPFEDLLKRDLLFAAKILGDGIEASPALMRSVTQQLLDLWLLGDRESVGRFDMIFHQARLHLQALDHTSAGQYAMQHALQYADDKREHVRAFLAEALTFWPSQTADALDTLVQLGRDDSSLVRRAVAEALRRLEMLNQDAYILLLSMISDPDKQVRRAARNTLRHAGEVPDKVMRVWVNLLHDNDAAMRQLGAKVLRRVGTLPPLVVGELLALLSDDKPEVRSAVAETLATVDALPDDALSVISHTIDHQQPAIRVAAIRALARPVKLSDEIMERLENWSRDAMPEVRLATVQVLQACRNETDDVLNILMDLTNDDILSVRQAAIEAMGRKGASDPRVAHTLLHLAIDLNPGIKISAGKALGNQKSLSNEAQDRLLNLLNDFNAGVRQAAMQAVGAMGVPYKAIVENLVDTLTDNDASDVVLAARTLTPLRGLPSHALVALVRLLPAYMSDLAHPISGCLYRHSPLPAAVIHPLVDLAKGASPKVRRLAINTLGHSVHAVPGIKEELFKLAGDTDINVRAAAISSLAHARDLPDHAIEVLFTILHQEELPIRQAAAVTLATLSHTLPHLGWDARRRQALVDTLSQLLTELAPRASWEPDVEQQNAILEALSWMAPNHRSDEDSQNI